MQQGIIEAFVNVNVKLLEEIEFIEAEKKLIRDSEILFG